MLTECVVSSITGSYVELGIFTHVCRVAVVGGGCCVETVVLFVVPIAYLYEFTVSRDANIRYFTSILVPCWLKGFPTMNSRLIDITYLYATHYV